MAGRLSIACCGGIALLSLALFLPEPASAQCVVDGDASPPSCDGDGGANTIDITGVVNETVSTFGDFDTVNLNGEIAPPDGDAGIVDNDGGLAVSGNGSITTTNADGISASGTGDVSVDGVQIDVGTSGAGIAEIGEGDVSVSNATITVNGQNAGDYGIAESGGGSVTVENSVVHSDSDSGINEQGDGDVVIQSSTVSSGGFAVGGPTGYGISEAGDGSVEVSDSTVFSTDNWGITEQDTGSVVVNNSTVYSTVNWGIREREGGNVEVYDSTVYSLANWAITEGGAGSVIVRNSTVYSTDNYAINEDDAGGVTVENSTVYSLANYAITTSGGGDVTITDSDVYTTDPGRAAIDHEGNGDELTFDNSRIASVAGGASLDSTGTGNTYNVLAGTVFEGQIDLSSPDNTFVFGPGLNTALQFNQLPNTITTNGLPLVVSGTTVAVVDVTGFAVTDEVLTDLTRSIAGTVETRLDARRSGHGDGRTVMGDIGITPVADLAAPARQTGLWGSIFGGYSHLEETSQTSAADHGFGGIVAGYDMALSASTVGGLFVGFAKGDVTTPHDAFNNDMTSGFGGAYVSHETGSMFLDASVLAGVMNNQTDRLINNNVVAGGLETASADYDGVLFSPSVKVGFNQGLYGSTLTPSLRVRYAGLYLDSYSESGSSVDMDVSDRNVHVVEVRGELAMALATREVGSGNWHTRLKGGIDGIFNWGDNVDATLLGTNISFAAGQEDSVIRGFAGAEATFISYGGTRFIAGVEAGYDSADTFSADARLGVNVPF